MGRSRSTATLPSRTRWSMGEDRHGLTSWYWSVVSVAYAVMVVRLSPSTSSRPS